MRATQNPYCAFKNDRERRIALLSRDIRIVIVVALTAYFGHVGWPIIRSFF
jgi:hypothetical protein